MGRSKLKRSTRDLSSLSEIERDKSKSLAIIGPITKQTAPKKNRVRRPRSVGEEDLYRGARLKKNARLKIDLRGWMEVAACEACVGMVEE